MFQNSAKVVTDGIKNEIYNSNAHYWKKKEKLRNKAEEHTITVASLYMKPIKHSAEYTYFYTLRDNEVYRFLKSGETVIRGRFPIKETTENNTFKNTLKEKLFPTFKLIQKDSVSALFKEYSGENNICVLNFASYKNAGGKFLEGSSAQEESLCHESFLYNVLEQFPKYYEYNRKHLNKGMYLHRALYSKDVFFIRDNPVKADVLTIAAPNYSVALMYGGFTQEQNTLCLKERMNFIKAILQDNPHITKVILGAWGCGVFKQNPVEVAELWKETFKGTGLKVIHAIPDTQTFNAFKEVYDKKEDNKLFGLF